MAWVGTCTGEDTMLSLGAGEGPTMCPPLGVLRILYFKHWALMTYMSQPITIIDWIWFQSFHLLVWVWLFLAVSWFWLSPSCWDLCLVMVVVLWLSSSDPCWTLLWCSVHFWAPLTAAIRCCCILNHFVQGSCVGALVSWSSFLAWSDQCFTDHAHFGSIWGICPSCLCPPWLF